MYLLSGLVKLDAEGRWRWSWRASGSTGSCGLADAPTFLTYGASGQPDPGDGGKAVFSDALKRVAAKFVIGRYLYSVAPVWRDHDPRTKQFGKAPAGPSQRIAHSSRRRLPQA